MDLQYIPLLLSNMNESSSISHFEFGVGFSKYMFFLTGIICWAKKWFQLGKHQFSNPIGQFHPSRSEVKLPMANGSPHGTNPQGSAVSKPLRSLGDLLQHRNLHG